MSYLRFVDERGFDTTLSGAWRLTPSRIKLQASCVLCGHVGRLMREQHNRRIYLHFLQVHWEPREPASMSPSSKMVLFILAITCSRRCGPKMPKPFPPAADLIR